MPFVTVARIPYSDSFYKSVLSTKVHIPGFVMNKHQVVLKAGIGCFWDIMAGYNSSTIKGLKVGIKPRFMAATLLLITPTNFMFSNSCYVTILSVENILSALIFKCWQQRICVVKIKIERRHQEGLEKGRTECCRK